MQGRIENFEGVALRFINNQIIFHESSLRYSNKTNQNREQPVMPCAQRIKFNVLEGRLLLSSCKFAKGSNFTRNE